MSTKARMLQSRGVRIVLVGIVVNIFLALVKGITGVLGHSYALIADAIESTSDIFTSIGVYLGLKIASKPADKNHPYGHGKAEPMAAVSVSLALFVAAFIIAVQSIREILTPHYAPEPYTLLILALVIAVKEILFRFVIKTGEAKRSLAIRTDAWHHRSDAITSAAAFIGISIALIGGKGFESADDIAALFASGVILFNAYRLIRPAIGELMDESPPEEIEKMVRKRALSVKGVKALDKCFIRKVGFDHYADLHVVVDGKISVSKGHRISHQVKEAIRKADPRIVNVLIHIEPYLKRKEAAYKNSH